ncbi:MAG: hypothetical protein IJW59_05890 [Clostridia bacterium]|nr:hypothetical protein [Clostridia bacterium]MBQ7352367.1 hypothetical protein [Clostridia bacterium]
MNKKLKKALLGLALVPCMFTAACFGEKDNNNNPPAPPTELTATEKNEAFLAMKTLTSQKKLMDVNSTAAKLGVSIEAGMDVDLSNSGLLGTAAEGVLAEKGIVDGETDTMTMKIMGESGYKANNTGYTRLTTEMKGMGESGKYVISEIVQDSVTDSNTTYTRLAKGESYSWVQNPQTEQMEWILDSGTVSKSAAYVSAGYVPNTYKELFSNDEMQEIFAPALEFLTEHASYTDLVADFDDFANEMLAEYGDGLPVQILENAVATADLTLTNGVYELKATIDIDDFDIPANDQTGEPASKVNMDVNMSVKFDSDSIDSIDMGVAMSQGATLSTYDVLTIDGTELYDAVTDAGVTVADDDTKTITNTQNLEMSIFMNTQDTFNETLMSEKVEDYTEGTIENISFENTFKFVGTEEETTMYVTYGNEVGTIDPEDLDLDNSTIALYWDEACTQPVAATDKYESYDKPIYVKVTPNAGYAFVSEYIVETYEDGEINGWPAFTPEHLVESGVYTLKYDNSFFEITKVEVNGVEVADYEDGITLESGKVYNITIYATEIAEK